MWDFFTNIYTNTCTQNYTHICANSHTHSYTHIKEITTPSPHTHEHTLPHRQAQILFTHTYPHTSRENHILRDITPFASQIISKIRRNFIYLRIIFFFCSSNFTSEIQQQMYHLPCLYSNSGSLHSIRVLSSMSTLSPGVACQHWTATLYTDSENHRLMIRMNILTTSVVGGRVADWWNTGSRREMDSRNGWGDGRRERDGRRWLEKGNPGVAMIGWQEPQVLTNITPWWLPLSPKDTDRKKN